MRNELKKIDNIRDKFLGLFVRYGTKTNWNGYPEPTILLKDIRLGTQVVSDHIWFSMTKGFEALGKLEDGDSIEFCARVKEYEKGYVNNRDYIDEREVDYRLSHPTKIKKISGPPRCHNTMEVKT